MSSNAPDNRCTVINPDGTWLSVTNLGWLLRHSYEVTAIHFVGYEGDGRATMTAHLSDGRAFQCVWQSIDVGLKWCNRPRLRHVQPISNVVLARQERSL